MLNNGDGKKIAFAIGALGMLVGMGAVANRLPPPSGSLPDLPGLRDRENMEPGFVAGLLRVINDTGANGDRLAAVISHESGFNPQAHNPHGAGGLLQWIPSSMELLGTSTNEVLGMSAIDQLDLVRKTIGISPGYKTDPAMAGAGLSTSHADDDVLWSQGQETYTENAGLDKAKKGYITAGDVRRSVYGLLDAAADLPRVFP